MATLSRKFNKKIALLGGAGPWASAYAHQRIVRLAQLDYGAVEDHDYPDILHLSVPMEGFGARGIEDADIVRDQVYRSFDVFQAWGADIAIIACNSLHTFYNELAQRNTATIVSLPQAGAEVMGSMAPSGNAVGILCSQSALDDNLHATALGRMRMNAIRPDAGQQERVNRMIYKIMGGDSSAELAREFRQLSQEFAGAGAQTLLSGCTELSWLASKGHSVLPIVDCLDAAINKTLKLAAAAPV